VCKGAKEKSVLYSHIEKDPKGGVMATKTIKVSDLTGEEIGTEESLARLVVEEHPDLPDPVTLEVLPDEVEALLPEEQNFVRVTYYPATEGGGVPRSLILSVNEFNNLSPERDMAEILSDARRAQQEEDGRRRGRRGRRATGERRQRIDYGSPEFAGMPHRGRVTEAEKAYVRNNLDAVNRRRVEAGHDPIDPANPRQAEKYGLVGNPESDALEQEMQGQTNL
jgi:hypothetical protein